MGFKQHISRTWQMIEQQVNDVPFRPDDETFGLIAGAQGRITAYTRDSADSLHQITTGLQQRKPWKCTD